MKHKKIAVLFSLILVLAMTLSACGTVTQSPDATSTPTVTATPTEVPTAPPMEKPTETPTLTPTPAPTEAPPALNMDELVDVEYLVDFDDDRTRYLHQTVDDELKDRKPYAFFDGTPWTDFYWTDAYGAIWLDGYGCDFVLKENVPLYGIQLQNFCYGIWYDGEGKPYELRNPDSVIAWGFYGYDADDNEYEIYASDDQELTEPYEVENRQNALQPMNNCDTPFIQFSAPVQYEKYRFVVWLSSLVDTDGNQAFVTGEVNLFAKKDEAPAKQDDKLVTAEKTHRELTINDYNESKWYWGVASKFINEDNSNAVVFDHEGAVDRDHDLRMWAKYDDEYLYLAFMAYDMSPVGDDTENYKGDGIQIRLTPNSDVMGEYLDISVTRGANSFGTRGAFADADITGEIRHIGRAPWDPWEYHILIKIRLEDIGVTPEAGSRIAFNLLRITGNDTGSYAGWMAYGDFFGDNDGKNPGLTENNIIIFE